MKHVMRESEQIGNIFLNKGEFLHATPYSFADMTGKKKRGFIMNQQRSQAPSRSRMLGSYLNTWETDTQLQILREVRACNQRIDSLRSDVAWSTLIISACILGLCVCIWIVCF